MFFKTHLQFFYYIFGIAYRRKFETMCDTAGSVTTDSTLFEIIVPVNQVD